MCLHEITSKKARGCDGVQGGAVPVVVYVGKSAVHKYHQ